MHRRRSSRQRFLGLAFRFDLRALTTTAVNATRRLPRSPGEFSACAGMTAGASASTRLGVTSFDAPIRLTPHPARPPRRRGPGRRARRSTPRTRPPDRRVRSGSGPGLVRLGAGEVGQALPPVFVWWRSFATRYVGSLCLHASGREDDAALPGRAAPTPANSPPWC